MNNVFDLNVQKILQDWKISDALRELMANAFDEAQLSQTSEPKMIYKPTSKEVQIIDFGRGIKLTDFVQNESFEKNSINFTIGKFGIGLKDAISVLFRYGKEIQIQSSFGTFKPIQTFKQGIDQPIETLHIEYEKDNCLQVETIITIQDIEEEDHCQAKNAFLVFNSLQLLAKSAKGEIYKRNETAVIYYQGMQISTDENFIFSYNILDGNQKLKRAFNRERKMLSRDAYRENIIAIWKSCLKTKNDHLTGLILQAKDLFANSEWSFLKIKELVLTNKEKELLFAPEESQNFHFLEYACQENKDVIFVNKNDYAKLQNIPAIKELSIDNFGFNYISNYEKDYVDPVDLSFIQKQNWDWLLNKVNLLAQYWSKWMLLAKQINWKIIKHHPHALAIHCPQEQEIQVVKAYLNSKETLFNNAIHEICHAVSNARDVSLEFEQTLTSVFFYLLKMDES